MAKIKVLNEGIEVEVPDGAAIKEYVKKESGMLFGCEQGDCGTCVCSIAKGSENINKKTQKEEQTINRLGLPGGSRLACQIRVTKGEVEIEY
ncbi:MAG TPA: 2Fe-2S iron-sulfur cluster-binding protein [Candidatus Bilamarchaeaceae archaeon]|nr:2Fe-2S iron-sulfur cluster-binding protein [Candidatus Bilamarchaeaceae archaeon]